MIVRDALGKVRRSRSAWLAGGFVLLCGASVAMAEARADGVDRTVAQAVARERAEATAPVAFPVTQPAAATPPASRAATSSPASMPASQPSTQPTSQPTSQPTTAPASQPKDADATPEKIQASRKRAQAADDLPEVEKKRILDLYDQALKQLELAKDWQAQAADSAVARQQAPIQLQQAEAKRNQPPPDLTPRIPADATLQQLEQIFAQAEQARSNAYAERSSLEATRKTALQRETEIPKRIAAIAQLRREIANQLNTHGEGSPEMERARQTFLQTQRICLRQESDALKEQLARDRAWAELLTVQQDLAARYVTAAASAYDICKQAIEDYRAAEVQRIADKARQERIARANDRPEIQEIARQNEELTRQRLALQQTAEQIRPDMLTTTELYQRRSAIQNDYDSMVKKMETAGLTEAVSSLLRRHRSQLPDVLQHERNCRRLEAEYAKAQLELIDLEDQRTALVDIERQVNTTLRRLDRSIGEKDKEAIRGQLREILQAKRKYLDDLIKDYNTYSKTWLDQGDLERSLIAVTETYAAYIDEHILWVRSTKPFQLTHVQHVWYATRWFADPAGWREVALAIGNDLQTNPVTILAGVGVFAALLLGRPRLRSRLRTLDERASRSYDYSFMLTLEATGLTVMMAVLWPGLMWFVGWRLAAAVTTSEFTGALAAGLRGAATLFVALEFVRQVCRRKGLGQAHLLWKADAVQLLRDNLAWLTPIAITMMFILSVVEWQANQEYRDSIGRFAFVVGMLALAVFAKRVLQPGGSLLADLLQRHADGWLDRLRYIWYVAAVAVPAAVALAAVLGYYYTAMQITSRLLATAGLVFLALMVKAMLLRLLFVARRRLAVEAACKREQARTAAVEPTAPAAPLPIPGSLVASNGAPVVAKEPEIDLATIDAQTRRLLRVLLLIGLLGGLYVTWADMLPALGILDRVRLWSTTVDVTQTSTDGTQIAQTVQKVVRITLGSAAWAGLILLLSFMAARNIPGLLEITVLRLMPLEPGGRYAINALSRYLIVIVGLAIACNTMGIGWSKVQWLAAAVTVGLGFGLQEIFANFVSGLIILFERPIRVGDVVTIGDISGTVSKIRIRATTIVNWDRKELIVPNKDLITGKVVNWTLTDPIVRLVISVGAAYGSDACAVQALLLKVAKTNPHVLATPQPSAFFVGFGDNCLKFQLRVFVPSPSLTMTVQGELNQAINDACHHAGIEVTSSQGVL